MLPSLAATPPREGATCAKSGATMTYKNKQFNCKKSGKKLVWSKGVEIKKEALASPSAKPSATPLPSSSATYSDQPKKYSVEMSKAHLPKAPPGGTDDYRCFLLDPKVTEDSIVRSIEFIPQQKNYVHHAIIFRVSKANLAEAIERDRSGTGWSCFGGSGLGGMVSSFVTSPWISAWGPGRGKDLSPDGYGIPFNKGEQFVLQVHYNLLAAPDGKIETDQSTIVMEAIPASSTNIKPLNIELFAAPVELACPQGVTGLLCDRGESLKDLAKRTDSTNAIEALGIAAICGRNPLQVTPSNLTSCNRNINSSYTVISAAPHMHLLGRKMRIILNPGTTREKILLNVDNYDFDNQSPVLLKTPVEVTRGDVIRLECTHDPILRQILPALKNQPPRYVTWGEGSSDEMCLGVLSVSRN
ncbi:MAG: monooxygenase [Actinobacteria bacterium]|nr:monooxygenase [Actinomycetota bacterium]